MERRAFIKAAIMGGAFIIAGGGRIFAREYYPVEVDETLWQGINRVKNPEKKTGLEMLHAPVINAPDTIMAGDDFPVDVRIGQTPHPMGPSHWIEHLQLNIGNEPAGTVIFRSHRHIKAAAKFDAVLDEGLKGKTVSLIVQVKCNIHGIWQNSANIKVV